MSDFLTEKTAALAAEREGMPVQQAVDETPTEPDQGDPEVVDSLVGDGADDVEDAEFTDEQPEEGDALDGDDAESIDVAELQSKYKSLEQEFSRVTAHRKQIEQSLDEATSAAAQRMHELDDQYGQAKRYVDYFAGVANQQVQQLQMHLNQPNLPPEQFQSLYNQLNTAQQNAMQFQQSMQQIVEQHMQAQAAQRAREAQVTMQRLKARVPDWNDERRAALYHLAQEIGYTQEEASDLTDFRVVSALNELHELRTRMSAVKEPVKKRKTQPPRSRSGTQPRNGKGQFVAAQKAFHEAKPGTRGAAAAMFEQRLRAEREGKLRR